MTRRLGIYKILLTLFLTATLGCKKASKEEDINFPITMYSEKAEVVSDTKVYVKNGVLNDPLKTRELMWIYSRYFSLENKLENAGENYLSFISKDSVTFYNRHSPYLIARNGDQLMMTSIIQSLASKPMLPNQLYHQVAKYQNIKIEGDAEISKDIKVAYGSGYSDLKIPMFAYVTSSWLSDPINALNRRGGLIVNEFNDDVIKNIGERDTIIVKKYMLIVKAK